MRARHDVISGLFFAMMSTGASTMAYDLGLGTLSSPGAGSIPFGVAAVLGLMSLGLIVKGLVQRKEDAGHAVVFRLRFWLKPLLVLAILVAYGAVFTRIGFVAATFCLMLSLTWGIGRQKLLLSLFVSATSVTIAYVLFVTFFGLPFPTGTIWPFVEG